CRGDGAVEALAGHHRDAQRLVVPRSRVAAARQPIPARPDHARLAGRIPHLRGCRWRIRHETCCAVTRSVRSTMNVVMTLLCPLSACAPTSSTIVSPPTSCRESDSPATCQVVGPGWGGPQGTFLEGPGLERLRFAVGGSRVPLPLAAGTELAPAVACGSASQQHIVIRQCTALSTGAATCKVAMTKDGLCGLNFDPKRDVGVVA